MTAHEHCKAMCGAEGVLTEHSPGTRSQFLVQVHKGTGLSSLESKGK